MLSRITGTVFVVSGERNELPTETQNKVNVGLNLKFNKKVSILLFYSYSYLLPCHIVLDLDT